MKKYAEHYVTTWESFQIIPPVGGTVVAFCGRTLALGRWNFRANVFVQMPGASPGSTPGMTADKCINTRIKLDKSFIQILRQQNRKLYNG